MKNKYFSEKTHVDFYFYFLFQFLQLVTRRFSANMDELDYKSLILYYGREKYFHSMQSKSIEALTKFPANPCFRLYNGIALCLGNRTQEGRALCLKIEA